MMCCGPSCRLLCTCTVVLQSQAGLYKAVAEAESLRGEAASGCACPYQATGSWLDCQRKAAMKLRTNAIAF